MLDNCEHLSTRCELSGSLERLPAVTVLATGRARLLSPSSASSRSPGCRSAATRATRWRCSGALARRRRRRPRTRRVRGSAGARRYRPRIELAAARLPSLGLDGIERGLAEPPVRPVAGGSRLDERHRSLRSDDRLELRAALRQRQGIAVRRLRVRVVVRRKQPRGRSLRLRATRRMLADALGRALPSTACFSSSAAIRRGHRTFGDEIRQYGLERLDAAQLLHPRGESADASDVAAALGCPYQERRSRSLAATLTRGA